MKAMRDEFMKEKVRPILEYGLLITKKYAIKALQEYYEDHEAAYRSLSSSNRFAIFEAKNIDDVTFALEDVFKGLLSFKTEFLSAQFTEMGSLFAGPLPEEDIWFLPCIQSPKFFCPAYETMDEVTDEFDETDIGPYLPNDHEYYDKYLGRIHGAYWE